MRQINVVGRWGLEYQTFIGVTPMLITPRLRTLPAPAPCRVLMRAGQACNVVIQPTEFIDISEAHQAPGFNRRRPFSSAGQTPQRSSSAGQTTKAGRRSP
jgi:hypothetical protein